MACGHGLGFPPTCDSKKALLPAPGICWHPSPLSLQGDPSGWLKSPIDLVPSFGSYWAAATVAPYCPGRMAENPYSQSTGGFNHSDGSPCISLLPVHNFFALLFAIVRPHSSPCWRKVPHPHPGGREREKAFAREMHLRPRPAAAIFSANDTAALYLAFIRN